MLTTGIQSLPEPPARTGRIPRPDRAGLHAASGDRCRHGIPRGPVHAPGRLRRSPDRHALGALSAPAPPVISRPADHGTVRRLRRRGADQAPGSASGAGPAGPAGRTMVMALLDLARVRDAGVPVPSSCGSWPDDRELRQPGRPARPSAQPVWLVYGVGHDARAVQPGRRGPAGPGWVHRVPPRRGPPGGGEPARQPGAGAAGGARRRDIRVVLGDARGAAAE